EKELAAEREQTKIERAISGYLDGVVREVTDETPLVHRLSTKTPAVLRADLQQIAEVMHAEGGDVSPKSVIAMLEQVMRQEAEEAGFEVAAKAETKPAKP